jgi:ABC-type uncharacterized transport system substrate-binding protein
METIGLLHSGWKQQNTRQVAALITGLAVRGYKKGTHYDIVETWAEDTPRKLANNAKGLVVDDRVKLIIAGGGPQAAAAAMKSTEAEQPGIPERDRKSIVFATVADPKGNNFVLDADAPGKNLTGMWGRTSELDDDRLKLIAQLLQNVSGRKKIKTFFKKNRPGVTDQTTFLQGVAAGLNMDLDVSPVDDDNDLDQSFATIDVATTHAILVTADSFFNNRRKKMVDKANNSNCPAIYQWREFVEVGGLMSYGPSINEAYVFAGAYAAKILFEGANPADMPLSEPTGYELVINLKTAQEIHLTIPDALKARAELIE